MRSSLLTRSVVAVASLAIGSVALAATPATAATPSGTTRDQVLQLAASARAGGNEISEATSIAAAAILNRECGYAAGRIVNPGNVTDVSPFGVDAIVDGVYLSGTVRDGDGQDTNVGECSIALVAPRSAGAVLSGQGNLTVAESSLNSTKTAQSTLSGDVGVTALPSATDTYAPSGFSYSANGTSTTTITSTTTETVKTSKTTAEKKAAKKTYKKRLASAKKAYKKAIAKAGKSKAKKAAAKKKYKAKKAAAKKAYLKAIAPRVTTITKTTSTPSSSTFAVSATSGN